MSVISECIPVNHPEAQIFKAALAWRYYNLYPRLPNNIIMGVPAINPAQLNIFTRWVKSTQLIPTLRMLFLVMLRMNSDKGVRVDNKILPLTRRDVESYCYSVV